MWSHTSCSVVTNWRSIQFLNDLPVQIFSATAGKISKLILNYPIYLSPPLQQSANMKNNPSTSLSILLMGTFPWLLFLWYDSWITSTSARAVVDIFASMSQQGEDVIIVVHLPSARLRHFQQSFLLVHLCLMFVSLPYCSPWANCVHTAFPKPFMSQLSNSIFRWFTLIISNCSNKKV